MAWPRVAFPTSVAYLLASRLRGQSMRA